MSAPAAVELVNERPGDLLAVVHYTDAEPVTVRRRGRASVRWTCGTHGDRATCGHALAVDLTLMARDALTLPAPSGTARRPADQTTEAHPAPRTPREDTPR